MKDDEYPERGDCDLCGDRVGNARLTSIARHVGGQDVCETCLPPDARIKELEADLSRLKGELARAAEERDEARAATHYVLSLIRGHTTKLSDPSVREAMTAMDEHDAPMLARAESAEARVAALEAALRPFAAIKPVGDLHDDAVFVVATRDALVYAGAEESRVRAWMGVLAGDLRRAARALARPEEESLPSPRPPEPEPPRAWIDHNITSPAPAPAACEVCGGSGRRVTFRHCRVCDPETEPCPRCAQRAAGGES